MGKRKEWKIKIVKNEEKSYEEETESAKKAKDRALEFLINKAMIDIKKESV